MGRADEQVVLVDADDLEQGTADKLRTHREGHLHRAVSVFLFDDRGRLLLQQRASTKHIFAGLWANTCCTHPRPGEDLIAAGRRRLGEEMGMDAPLRPAGVFRYEAADYETGLVEAEIDHVIVGTSNSEPSPNSSEVSAVEWVDVDVIRDRLDTTPNVFAPWLAPALDVVAEARLGRSE